LNGCGEGSQRLESDSYPESVDVELPEECLELGENRDHSDTGLLLKAAGDGDAGGDGGSAKLAQSTVSTYT